MTVAFILCIEDAGIVAVMTWSWILNLVGRQYLANTLWSVKLGILHILNQL